MLSSDETKSGGKPNQRKTRRVQSGDKARQRKQKTATQVPEVDRPQAAPAQTNEPVGLAETALPSAADTPPTVPAASEESAPVSYRAFAEAWSNYSRTSLEQTKAYFEKLAGVHSLGAALEVQAEFAKQACETFVAQSQRIGELQGELARQRLKRLEGFMEKMTGTRQS
jgi:hypothetical protein